MRKFTALLAALVGVLAACLIAAPAAETSPTAPAVGTTYTWSHKWDYTGNGVLAIHSGDGFYRISYYHTTNSCTEGKFIFHGQGFIATYYRHTGISGSCDGLAWNLVWTSPAAGLNSSLSWQHDDNMVLRTASGGVVWASNTAWGNTTELQTLYNSGHWSLDHYVLCCYWTRDRSYP